MNPHATLSTMRSAIAFLRQPQEGDHGWTDEEANDRERAYERLVDLVEALDAHMTEGGPAPDAWSPTVALLSEKSRKDVLPP